MLSCRPRNCFGLGVGLHILNQSLRVSGVIQTMWNWKMYKGSLLSIAVGDMSSKKRVCTASLWVGSHLIWIAGAVD